MLIRLSAIDQIGGFDENHIPPFEKTDLRFRAPRTTSPVLDLVCARSRIMRNSGQSTTPGPRRRVYRPPDANRAVDSLPSTIACVLKAICRHRKDRANAGRECEIPMAPQSATDHALRLTPSPRIAP